MSRGYTGKFTRIVNDADQTKIGVQLAKICIQNNIPATDVAEFMGVTKMTVYHWFKGKTNVLGPYKEKVEKLIQKLSS
jgi:transcriptional regulator with XRE-family HTH domain